MNVLKGTNRFRACSYIKMESNDDTVLARLAEGSLTEAERAALPDLAAYERLLAVSKLLKPPDFDVARAYQNLLVEKGRLRPTSRLRPLYVRLAVAATLALALAAVVFVSRPSAVEVQTAVAETRTVELPDHSRLSLNAGSMATFRSDVFGGRHLRLEGEAYLEVTKGKKFEVVTGQGTVTVLGTRFNVRAQEGLLEVTCFEGKVAVRSGTRLDTLTAGMAFLPAQDNRPVRADTLGPDWTQGVSRFAKQPLKRVFEEFERQYGKKVVFQGVDVDRVYSGAFVHGDVEKALTMVCTPMKLRFKVETDKVYLYPAE